MLVQRWVGWVVLRTTDGGQTWHLNILQPPVDVIGPTIVDFASPNEGWIAVEGKKEGPIVFKKQFIYHTGDSGVTWEIEYQREAFSEDVLPLSDIHYASGVAIVVGWGGTVLRNTVTPETSDTTSFGTFDLSVPAGISLVHIPLKGVGVK